MAQHVPGAARSGGPLMAFAPAIDKLRHRVVDRQEGVCPRCGERLADDVHLTMIRPVGKGGRIDAGNLVATHRLCNIEPDFGPYQPGSGLPLRVLRQLPHLQQRKMMVEEN